MLLCSGQLDATISDMFTQLHPTSLLSLSRNDFVARDT